jgi:hypothetical protein
MVRGIFDRGQAIGQDSQVYREMKGISGNPTYNWNPPARVYLDNYPGLLHDKYMLIDPDMPSSNPVVATGSFNYSSSAQSGNDEEEIFIFDSLIANQYFQDFSKRLSDAGGLVGLNEISNVVPDKFELFQNYPNPFNPSTKINFAISKNSKVTINVFNVLGQKIQTLVDKNLNAGLYQVEWNPGNVGSGVYYYVLKTENFSDTKKMLYIK